MSSATSYKIENLTTAVVPNQVPSGVVSPLAAFLQSIYPVGLGCFDLSHITDPKQAITVLHEAFHRGVNFFDTANVYFKGENEKLLAQGLKGLRHQVVIASKAGLLDIGPEKLNNEGMLRADPGDLNGSPDYLIKAVENSLRRLKTDYIDILYLHRVDPRVKLEESMKALSMLVKQGKVRFLGLSEVSATEIIQAHNIHPISFVQPEYSLWTRDIEQNDVFKTCQTLNIQVVAYGPVGRGFFSHNFNGEAIAEKDYRLAMPRFEKTNLLENIKLRKFAEMLALAKGCSLAQLALAWILSKNIIPIPGTTKVAHLLENANAVDFRLSLEEQQALDAAYPPGSFIGQRI